LVKHSKNPKDRVGTISSNRYGSIMIADDYINSQKVIIRFIESDEVVTNNWDNFIEGKIRSLNDKSVCNIGFIGVGKYRPKMNGEIIPQYLSWHSMITRCYDLKFLEKVPSYKDVTVCEDWHCFQNFAKWFDENYYEIEGERMNLDKDILIKGNKVYSPNTCIFAPHTINSLFVKGDKKKDDLPKGVYFFKGRNKYQARCSNRKGQSVSLGYYDTVVEAFQAYKAFKENIITDVAYKYKDKIPEKLFNALIDYKIDYKD
jgi:hypothetical protein